MSYSIQISCMGVFKGKSRILKYRPKKQVISCLYATNPFDNVVYLNSIQDQESFSVLTDKGHCDHMYVILKSRYTNSKKGTYNVFYLSCHILNFVLFKVNLLILYFISMWFKFIPLAEIKNTSL